MSTAVGETRFLVGADGARSRVARHCGLGEVRQFLYGIEYEFPGARLSSPDALHCFISKRYAPGYIGWLLQSPTGVQAGLAMRHDPARARVPDIDEFLLHVGIAGGLPRLLKPGQVRAGLIPCGGPVARDGARCRDPHRRCRRHRLAGDRRRHPLRVGARLRSGRSRRRAPARRRPSPEQVAIDVAPRFRSKRVLRWAFDHLQMDWPFDLLPAHRADALGGAGNLLPRAPSLNQIHSGSLIMELQTCVLTKVKIEPSLVGGAQ
jgi:hypothetical protein